MVGKRTKKKSPGRWIDDIMDSVGCFVHLETRDGISREGELSGLKTLEIEMDGEVREFPVAIELNGDSYDEINLISLQRITIDKKDK